MAGSASEAVIDGSAHSLGMIIEIDAENAVINGLEVKSGTGDMIKQNNTHSGAVVKYCIIHDGLGDEGVQLKKCTNGVLEYNYVYDIAFAGDALNISDGSSNGKIRYNEVYDIGSENAAIYVYDSDDMEIVGNLVYHVTQNDAIKLGKKSVGDADQYGGLIKDNVTHDVAQDGITVYMNDVTVEGNEVYDCHSENGAIYLAYAISNIDIHGNSVHDNTLDTGKWGDPGGIMIGTAVDAATVHANHNNISGNTPNGVTNKATAELDAENNWWGDASGPTTSPGSGDKVSANVDYTPWLGAPLELPAVHHESLGAGAGQVVDASDEADTTVTLTTTGDTEIYVARYESQPFPDEPFPDEALGKYIDIHVSNPDAVEWPIHVEVTYTDAEVADTGIDEDTLGLYYYESVGTFHRCSDTGVNMAEKFIWANVTRTEAAYLEETAFGAGGSPLPPVGGEAYPVNKLAILAPWIALGIAVIASATIFMRRRRAQS